jgi:class 3 adenylate cyclase/tetratricopeptide (TPR) repeat protein
MTGSAPANDVTEWLRGLGLERFAPVFAQQEIELSVLPDLTEIDLRDLGIPMGPRKQILKAIADLRQGNAAPASTADAPSGQPADRAERRHVTIMFCDLIGSTALSVQFDPEDMREVIRAFQLAVAEEVRRFGGFVASYMGDGALTYFGYPEAHEDDAERAVLMSLALVERVARLETHAKLQVRIGIATGLVVVGDLVANEGQKRGAVGETPNLAARMQQLAPDDGIVIAEGTRRLLGNLFELRDLGAVAVKGFERPVPVWQVVRPSVVESRFEALRAGNLIPLVGRGEELELLLGRWQRAKAAEGQVVLLSGDAGIGKSRLTAALRQRVEGERHVVVRYYCSAHHQHSALYPFITQLERAAGFVRDQTADERLDKLEALLAPELSDPKDLALVAELLSLPTTRYPALLLSPQRRKETLFTALLRLLEGVARRQPVLMAFEDLHWIDPTSRELLDQLIERVASLPVLLIATFRPETQVTWTGLSHVTALTLNRLDARMGAAMIAQILGSRPLAADLAAEIVERADGVPLFLEELTQAVIEGGAGEERGSDNAAARAPLPSARVPATLHASLLARLDRLGAAAREIAQIGAVIGREFPYELLTLVSAQSGSELDDALQRLTESGLLFQRGTWPGASFLFKHALVRDAAYASLLRNRRRELHARIAAALEVAFAGVVEARPELLAFHLTQAGEALQAIRFWQLAGQRATRLSSYVEANHHFSRALDVLRTLPDAQAHARQELDLLVALATVQLATHGYGAPEVAATFSQAKERCYALGESEHLTAVLFGEWACACHRQAIDEVDRLGRRLRSIAKRSHDPGEVLMGERVLGNSLLFAGRFAQARLYLGRAARNYDERRDRNLALRYGLDLLTASLSQLMLAEWWLGSFDAAAAVAERALVHSERIEHGNSLALAIVHAGLFFEQFRNNPKEILSCAKRLHDLAEGGGFPMFISWCRVIEGWAMFQLDARSDGIAEMKDGIRNGQGTGSSLHQPYFLTLLAQCHAAQSEVEYGLDAVAQALRFAEGRGELWYAAETYRVKAELLRHRGDHAGATGALRHALGIARRQRNAPLTQRIKASLGELIPG